MNDGSKIRVLAIDDNVAIHDDYRKVLCGWSEPPSALDGLESLVFGAQAREPKSNSRLLFELETADQGQDGLAKVRAALTEERPFSIAFVDMQMPPGWDGLRTIQEIWKVAPELHIVICTAYSDRSWDEIVATLGTTDRLLLLRKPFDPNEVLQIASSLSEKVRLQRISDRRMHELTNLAAELQCVNDRLQDEIEGKEIIAGHLRESATKDSLTGLRNRGSLMQRLEGLPEVGPGCPDRIAAIYVDVDNFKTINDSLGHEIGDRYLMGVAGRLREAQDELRGMESFRIVETYRLGGDEFVVLLVGPISVEELEQAMENLRTSTAEPLKIGQKMMPISLSLGASGSGGRKVQPEALLREADTAMYRAKAAGKGRSAIFDEAMNQELSKRIEIERDLHIAAAESSFEVVYQPIVDLKLGEVVSLEALVRWPKRFGTMVTPDQFIPLAEQNGTILSLGRCVLRRACFMARAWNSSGREGSPVSINVNVSRRQLQDSDFLSDLDRILEETAVPPALLNVEVTESAMIESPEIFLRRLQEIRRRGVRVHMDDFGTGYSSLSFLHQMPLDAVKIDRSFTTHLATRTTSNAVMSCIVMLAHQLGMKVTVEGVETREQARRIADFGCDSGQGYYYAKPMPETDVLRSLEEIRRRLRVVRDSELTLVGPGERVR